jgi:hypothetical protein
MSEPARCRPSMSMGDYDAAPPGLPQELSA